MTYCFSRLVGLAAATRDAFHQTHLRIHAGGIGDTGRIKKDPLPLGVDALRTGPFRRRHGRGEIILYPVSTTSLVRHRAGVGEPLVLLHGVGESAVGWRPVQQALSRAYDVIALDFPGFGGSAKLPAHALPNAMALADA